MDTARCRAFVAAAESGSFTKAAEILKKYRRILVTSVVS